MRRMLAFEDVLAIAARSDATRGIVLVGGQALNFWSDYFEIVTPATEDKFGVALSNDIDFVGGAREATAFAAGVGGSVRIAGEADAHSPNTALVMLRDGGDEHIIDFLGSLNGFSPREFEQVAQWAVPVRLAPESDAYLQVMHPVHCLQAQLANVYGPSLDRRSGPGGERHARRVRLAVEASRRTVLDLLGRGAERNAFKVVERLHAVSLLEPALRARVLDGIEVECAIPVARMPAIFRERRAESMQRALELALGKYERLLARRAAIATKKAAKKRR